MIIGDPTWSFAFGGGSFPVSQHLTATRDVMDPLYHTPDCVLEKLVKEAKDKAMEEGDKEANCCFAPEKKRS